MRLYTMQKLHINDIDGRKSTSYPEFLIQTFQACLLQLIPAALFSPLECLGVFDLVEYQCQFQICQLKHYLWPSPQI